MVEAMEGVAKAEAKAVVRAVEAKVEVEMVVASLAPPWASQAWRE
jgi:hypothetical protein